MGTLSKDVGCFSFNHTMPFSIKQVLLVLLGNTIGNCMVLSSKSKLLWLFGTWKYILAWKVTWIFECSYFCPCLDFLIFLAQHCLASAHFSLSVLFCVSLVPMAAVAETTDASAGDSVRTFLDTDCAVSTVFFVSQYKLSAQFLYLNNTTSLAVPLLNRFIINWWGSWWYFIFGSILCL